MRTTNTDLVVIRVMTSLLELLDMIVNKLFKDNLWQLYSDWLLKGNDALTPSSKLKPSVNTRWE
jgi:hypothetical protein